jgi:outer membrane protein
MFGSAGAGQAGPVNLCRDSNRLGRCRHLSALVLVILTGLAVAASVAGAAAVTVEDCVRAALAYSPAVRVAASQVDAASAQLRAARSAYAPRLLAEAEYGRSQGFDETVTNGGSTAALLTVEATLLDGGLRDAQFAAARARLRGTSARMQQQRADVALATRVAYFTALARRREGGIQRDTLRTLRAYVALLQAQESRGLVPRNDVLRAQLAVDTTKSARRAAVADLRDASSLLRSLTGLEVTPSDLVEPATAFEVEAGAKKIDASPILVDARAAVQAARHDADVVRSDNREKLTLTANGGVLGIQPGPTFHDNGGGQFLFGFRLPIFDGGVVASRVAAAVATTQAAEANVQLARQTVDTAFTRAEVEAQRAHQDVAAWRQAIPKAEENFELMRARYFGGGNVRLLEVLDALNQAVDAKLNLQTAVLSYRVAVATEHQILGETTP